MCIELKILNARWKDLIEIHKYCFLICLQMTSFLSTLLDVFPKGLRESGSGYHSPLSVSSEVYWIGNVMHVLNVLSNLTHTTTQTERERESQSSCCAGLILNLYSPPPNCHLAGFWKRKDSPQQQLQPLRQVHPGQLPGEWHREGVRLFF